VHEALVEVAFARGRRAPRELQLLVRLEVRAAPDQVETAIEVHAALCTVRRKGYRSAVATILLCGVDLFFRAKLEGLLPEHRFTTTESIDPPDLVIADIARVDAADVADSFPDVPLLGFTNHTDTAGLRRANTAGFDQVCARSALFERTRELIDPLLASVE
jgi:hypothetical protein